MASEGLEGVLSGTDCVNIGSAALWRSLFTLLEGAAVLAE